MTRIVALTEQDFEEWLPLWRGYQIFYKADIDEETTRTTFARLTGGAEPMGAFLARDDAGRAIGMVHWIMHRSCWTTGDYCYLQDLFVAPDIRGGGVGAKLIEAVYDVAQKHGCSRVHWLTQFTNERAMILYDKVATKSGFLQYVKRF
ncbi:MAG: GNAT family N-acetyltransferase [Methylobacteriaceae bacterium]|nr:GNAT family N-acetyltransferase [Methylobacteriaceae bacterium]